MSILVCKRPSIPNKKLPFLVINIVRPLSITIHRNNAVSVSSEPTLSHIVILSVYEPCKGIRYSCQINIVSVANVSSRHLSISPRHCSAHKKHYTSSHFSVPGNPDNLYSPKWLLFTTRLSVVRQLTDRWQKKGVRTLSDALVFCVFFPL